MIRVHVICEGQTEEMFVKELLQPALTPKGVLLIPALVGRPGHKGGNFKFGRLYVDIEKRLLGDKTSFCTTFFDYYGLPQSFPGKHAGTNYTDIAKKAETVQQAMIEELTKKLGVDPMRRFIPFVQMYEFEALLFSSPNAFARGIDKEELEPQLSKIANQFETPEHINNSYKTAPSKRIEALIPDYQKPILGILAALEIGLNAMRDNCPLFNNWLTKLEAL